MRRLRAASVAVLLACGLLLLAAHPAYAAEEGGEPSPLTRDFKWINFAIVAAVIGWLLVKKAPGFFAARAGQIASAIDEAAKVKAQADGQRREAEQRLANLGSEIEELRAAARRDAAAEGVRIQAATQEEAAKIERAAQMEVEAAARGARIELRAMASRLSIELAEAILRSEITAAADDGMFAAFLGDLARPGGQAGRRN
ncbi:MAG TPA: ATP synthase F0 subunit B [Candidatus Acidoferrales bacterium]|nr:ATP synthase F0 subunit B [Candidatus Acidoferrales bacterium]